MAEAGLAGRKTEPRDGRSEQPQGQGTAATSPPPEATPDAGSAAARCSSRPLDLSSTVVLVGMMGVGKSTVGPVLAARLGLSYADSDTLIEAESRCSVPQVFATRGEEAFRQTERETVARLLAGDHPLVVSLGGGAVTAAPTRQLLGRAGAVLWLKATLRTLGDRLGEGQGRPMLAGGVEATLTRLSRERDPLYAEVADAVIDVDGLTPEEISSLIVELR